MASINQGRKKKNKFHKKDWCYCYGKPKVKENQELFVHSECGRLWVGVIENKIGRNRQ